MSYQVVPLVDKALVFSFEVQKFLICRVKKKLNTVCIVPYWFL